MVRYWRFYWPLALTGVALVLSVQFQNAALARYPEAVTELAVFALGYGTFGFFRASLNFIAQLSNVFARSVDATRRCQRFVVGVAIVLIIPQLLLGSTEAGATALAALYRIEPDITGRVQAYLVYLAPVLLLGAQRFHYTGLLVQAELTGWVTLLNVLFLAAVILGLIVGFQMGLAPVLVLVGSETAAIALQVVVSGWVKHRYYRLPEPPVNATVTYGELIRFFVPTSLTGVMFALSRPVLYGFVSRTPDGLLAIAAMRIAFDFSMIFQQAANQFRHFFVTFGLDDLAGKRRFMAAVAGGITGIMLTLALTRLLDWIWRVPMRIPDDVRRLAGEVFLVMCLLPLIIVIRNYFHGRLMVERRTAGMAVGSVLRVAGIYVGAWACVELQWLNHVSASVLLLLGFVIETAVVLQAAARGQAERVRATANR